MIHDESRHAGFVDIDCTSNECGRRFRAACLIPTISRNEQLGKLRCPYCGYLVRMDPELLWVGLPVAS